MLEAEFFTGVAMGLFLTCLYLVNRSFFKVEEGHVAVVTEFGKVQTKPGLDHVLNTYNPGLHWIAPWKKVHITSMMERSLDLSGESGGITAMAEDGTILRLDSKLRFSPLKEDLYTYLFIMRNPSAHIKGLFTCLLRNEIANFGSNMNGVSEAHGGSYALIRRERQLLNKHIDDFCKGEISGRYGGVQFFGVDVTDILPPDELAEALNAVIHAQSEAEGLYARTQAESQQRVLSAQKGVGISAARAKACEIEILKLAEFLRELDQNGTLKAYVARRRSEILAESRAVFRRNAQ